MDFAQIIRDLMSTGMTQAEIAREVGRKPSWPSMLLAGGLVEPAYSVGQKLIALHAQRCGKQTPQKAAA